MPSHLVCEVRPEYDVVAAGAGIDESMIELELGRERVMFPAVDLRGFIHCKLSAESPLMGLPKSQTMPANLSQ